MTHTRTSTDCGPDYCAECSAAVREWVRWPCDTVNACRNCGAVMSDGVPRNPEYCGNCPPWTCTDCGQPCSAAALCSCWTDLTALPLADIKAIFAADGTFNLGGIPDGAA